MKKIITDGLGGHPVKFLDFEFVQEQIREIITAEFGSFPSNKVVVVSGCSITTDESDTSITAGYVVYGGELYAVAAKSIQKTSLEQQAKWRIVTNTDTRGNKTFADGSQKSVYVNKQMEIFYVFHYEDGIPVSETESRDKYVGGVPIGSIVLWSGTEIPAGWALCNGQQVNGMTTPNLSGRMVIGYNSGDEEYNSPGNLSMGGSVTGKSGTGGGKKASFGVSDIPKHRHGKGDIAVENGGTHSHAIGFKELKREANDHSAVLDYTVPNPADASYIGGTVTSGTATQMGAHGHSITGETADAGGAATTIEKDVRHPWYILAYIMRVG